MGQTDFPELILTEPLTVSSIPDTPDISEILARRADVKAAVETALSLIQPSAPHIAEELWQRLGHDDRLWEGPWPKADPEGAKKVVADALGAGKKLEFELLVQSGDAATPWVAMYRPRSSTNRCWSSVSLFDNRCLFSTYRIYRR